MQRLQRLPTSVRTLAFMLLNALLLSPALGAKSIWLDEAVGQNIAEQVDITSAYQAYRSSEVQPPLNTVLLVLWTRVFGAGDARIRIPAVLFTIASVGLLLPLATRLAGRRVAWIAVYLMAISPFLVLFGRMSRYYAPTMFLTIASALTLLWAFGERGRGRTATLAWSLHALSLLGLLLANYTAIAYFLCQSLFGLGVVTGRVPVLGSPLTPDQTKRLGRPWFITTAAVTLAFGAWVIVDSSRLGGRGFGPRPSELLGIARLVMDAAYPLYAWGVGATIFPWHPAAVIATVVLAAVLILGVHRLLTSRGSSALVSLGFLGTLGITVLAYQLYVQNHPFETIPTRAISAFPFFLITLGIGIERLRPTARAVAIGLLTVAAVFAVANYHSGREFHNAIYTVPTRELTAEITSSARPGDVVVDDVDTLVAYHLRRLDSRPCSMTLRLSRLGTERAALRALRNDPPNRIWRVRLGRDGTARLFAGSLDRWVNDHYRLLSSRGYAPQDRTYARLKERLQGEDAYRYKVTVALYERSAPSNDRTTPCDRGVRL